MEFGTVTKPAADPYTQEQPELLQLETLWRVCPTRNLLTMGIKPKSWACFAASASTAGDRRTRLLF